MADHSAQVPSALRARLNAAITERGLSVRQVILRLPELTVPTMYRVIAGTTRDPRTSTLLALCRAIDIDPDDLLDALRPALEPEAAALLDDAEALDEADRWLLVDLVRVLARRRSPS